MRGVRAGRPTEPWQGDAVALCFSYSKIGIPSRNPRHCTRHRDIYRDRHHLGLVVGYVKANIASPRTRWPSNGGEEKGRAAALPGETERNGPEIGSQEWGIV